MSISVINLRPTYDVSTIASDEPVADFQVLPDPDDIDVALYPLLKGEPGINGTNGLDGAPGPAGGATYEFDQNVAAATWHIVHNLGRIPTVVIIDSAESVVEGDVQYIDLNSLNVFFSVPFGGRAFLN